MYMKLVLAQLLQNNLTKLGVIIFVKPQLGLNMGDHDLSPKVTGLFNINCFPCDNSRTI